MGRICVLGGSGFIGRHIVEKLVERGDFVVVPTRSRERSKHLIMLPTVEVVQADVHDPATLRRVTARADAVVNLIGILQSRSGSPYGPDFARVHVELAQKVIAACIEAKVPRLAHMSALKAAPDGPSAYLRSKGDAEAALIAARAQLATTIFRPSVVFGPEDRFLNVFAALARRLPALVLACPDAKFQPVYVADVAAAFVASLDTDAAIGRAYDLVGPKVYRLRELADYAGRAAGHPRAIVGLSDRLSYFQAWLMEHAPGKLMSRDNYYSMQIDNTSDEPLPFGIQPTALESVAPLYLKGIYPRSRYSAFRHYAGRSGVHRES